MISMPLGGNDRSEWILQQDDKHYTIQLTASREKAGAVRYLKKLPKSLQPFIYHFRKDGITWYVVATSIHTDYKAAKRSIKNLPAKLRKDSPWVRNIGIVKKRIEVKPEAIAFSGQ